MRFGSVCSGIEAASVAWEPLGWKAAWFSEIEPFPSAVLAHHYPDVPNLGDMTALPERIRSGEIEAPDLFCGGTPCQAFSVAGNRRSLDDARGNLSLIFCEIANAIDDIRRSRGEQPAVIFWENVPGVLSTKDNAFGCFLGELAGESCELKPPGGKWTNAGCVFGPTRAVAWRLTDAQYFGVAQRRRRVFVVASARDGLDPTKILFESEGVRRDIAPSREARKDVTECAGTLTANGGGLNRPAGNANELDFCVTVEPCAASGKQTIGTLMANAGTKLWLGNQEELSGDYHILSPQPAYAIQSTIIGRSDTAGPQGSGISEEVSFTLTKADQHGVAQPIPLNTMTMMGRPSDDGRMGSGIGEPGDPCPTLTKAHCHAVAQPVAFQETADCLTAAYGTKWNGNASATNGSLFAAQPIVLMDQGGSVMNVMQDGTVGTLLRETKGHEPVVMHSFAPAEVGPAMGASGPPYSRTGNERVETEALAITNMAVRRLTPTECERLQGFPDGYTNIPWRKQPESPDGPRYKALGNSWAVPNVRWIGQRIDRFLRACTGSEIEPKRGNFNALL